MSEKQKEKEQKKKRKKIIEDYKEEFLYENEEMTMDELVADAEELEKMKEVIKELKLKPVNKKDRIDNTSALMGYPGAEGIVTD